MNCQLDVTNSLISANVSKDVLTSCLDGITLTMTANFISTKDDGMSSSLISNMKFAKGLCSTTSLADEFLFGSDTAKRVKEMAELTKQGRNQRFHPYSIRGSESEFSQSAPVRAKNQQPEATSQLVY